jgi:opacity protein-like surface antigen
MRRSLIALWLIALMSNAFAADYELPDLRGASPFVPAPPIYTRWTGFYAGGQISKSNSIIDFSHATRTLVAFSLRELALENVNQVSQCNKIIVGKSEQEVSPLLFS